MKSIVLVSAVTLPLSFSVMAENLSEAMQACAQQKNSLKRLVCYDNITASMGQYSTDTVTSSPATNITTAPETTPAATSVASAPQSITSEDSFGIEHKASADEKLADRLDVTLVSVKTLPRGESVFTFTNGQVWQQVGEKRFKLVEGAQIYIERALFDTFNLRQDGVNRFIKVKRIK